MNYILLGYVLFSFYTGFSQSDTQKNILVNDTSLLTFIEERLIDNYYSKFSNIGEWGICWIRVELTQMNKVSDVLVSTGTNPILGSFLKETIGSVSNKWAFTSDFNNEQKVLIIPLWYNFQKEGGARKVDNNSEQILSLLLPKGKTQKVIVFPKLEYISPFY
jgi:hypothetical protein